MSGSRSPETGGGGLERFALKEMLTDVLSVLRKEHTTSMVSWIERNGELTIGDTRYCVGTERKTRMIRKDAAVLTIIE